MGQLRHPRLLPVLFFTEMWERFSFYLMLFILPLYLVDSEKGGMGWNNEQAAVLVGSYLALVYFTPFIGGLIADRLLGCRRTILIGGTLMMIGHLVLAYPGEVGLYLGLLFLILGNGAFKPNISTLVGHLYPPGSPLKDAGYNIFYMGINVGAFICNFVAAWVRNYCDKHPIQITPTWTVAGWHAAFATAAVGMFLGLLTFLAFYGKLAEADRSASSTTGPRDSLNPLWIECLLPAILLGALMGYLAYLGYLDQFGLNIATSAFLGACVPVIVFYVNIWRRLEDPTERGRVAGLLVIFGVVITFWAVFHLSSTAMNVWARDSTDRRPGPMARLVTDHLEEFAEPAPPSYYVNASPDTPRPSKDTFIIVSPEKYKELQESKQLSVVQGQKVYVTQEMFDKVYANASSQTPFLAAGEHLRLVNTELYQSVNAGCVILFTPLVVAFWSFLRRRNAEPSAPAKIGLGLLLTAVCPVIMLVATWSSNDSAVKASPMWMFAYYAQVTLGELCLSPMGLSLVNKMAPARISAFMMGGWFLATSFGNKLSGIFGEVYEKMNHYTFWTMLAVSCAFFGMVILALLPWLRRQMVETKEAT